MLSKLTQIKSLFAKRIRANEEKSEVSQVDASTSRLNSLIQNSKQSYNAESPNPDTAQQAAMQPMAGTNVEEKKNIIFMAEFADQTRAQEVVDLSLAASDCLRAEIVANNQQGPYLAAVELSLFPEPTLIRTVEETMKNLAEALGGYSRGWQFAQSPADASPNSAMAA